jgi:hypothetical protein
MGTDIHINVDRLSENGHWTRTDLQVDEDRNYDLFAILADVRNGEGCAGVRTGDGFVPISEPCGWGEVDVKEDDPYHSASWLLLSEILDYDYSQKTFKVGIFNEDQYAARLRGEPLGYCTGISGANIVVVTEGEYTTLGKPGYKPRRTDKSYYIRVSWETTYWKCVGDWVERLRKQLAPLGDPSKVRLVFCFDS